MASSGSLARSLHTSFVQAPNKTNLNRMSNVDCAVTLLHGEMAHGDTDNAEETILSEREAFLRPNGLVKFFGS